nr:serine protease-like protein [Yponomeuta cagnagella]
MVFKAALLLTLLQFATARTYSCSFSRNLRPGDHHQISSPMVPAHYNGLIDCHWYVACPDGYICLLDCPEVKIPESKDCMTDALVLQTSENTLPRRYCGNETITTTSLDTDIRIALRTQYGPNGGGKFFCQVTCIDSSKESIDDVILEFKMYK